jgi:HD superfamily phosphohydrolase
MNFSRVINGDICFHAKEAYNVYELFHTRYSMHKQVYSHRVGKAIEYMVFDAFQEADPFLGIRDAVSNVEDFQHLHDHLLTTIESSKQPVSECERSPFRFLEFHSFALHFFCS